MKEVALIFAVISAFAAIIHWQKQKKDKDYFRNLLSARSMHPKQSDYLDYLRVTATLFVIGVHVLSSTGEQPEIGSAAWMTVTFLCTLLLTCNPLFVMISGTLLLNGKEEPLSVFYCKRVARAVIPLIAYYCFYMLIPGELFNFYPGSPWKMLKQIIEGPFDAAPHFWLIYVILSLYITAPFFRVMMKHMSDGLMRSLVIAVFVFQGLVTYLPVFQMSLGIQTVLTTWEGIFLLGYFFNHPSARAYDNLFLCMGGISYLISILWILYYPAYEAVIYNGAPTMIAMSGAIFVLFRKFQNKLPKPGVILRNINRYSYSILLIHWYVLFYIIHDILKLNGAQYHPLGANILMILSTLFVSLIFAFIFDNTVVFCLEVGFEKILYFYRRIVYYYEKQKHVL